MPSNWVKEKCKLLKWLEIFPLHFSLESKTRSMKLVCVQVGNKNLKDANGEKLH